MAKEAPRKTPAPPQRSAPQPQPSRSIVVKPSEITKAGESLVPDYLQLRGRAPQGAENVEQGDLIVPRLALCQSGTPQRKKSDPRYIQGLEEGDFFNNVSGKNHGNKVNFIPVFFFRTRILFNPMDDGGGIRCIATDATNGVGDPGGECLKCKYRGFGNGCTEFRNFAAIVVPEGGTPNLEDALVVSFKSTGSKAAKKLITLNRTRNRDMFATIYTMTCSETTNDKGTFFVPDVEFCTEPTSVSANGKGIPPSWVSKDMYEVGKLVYKSMKAMQAAGTLRVDMSDEEGHDAAETGGDGGDTTFDPDEIESR